MRPSSPAWLLLAALVAPGCGQPFDDHAGFDACMVCHEDNRPQGGHYEGQDCSDCHGTRSWDGASFDHDPFRLPHHGVQACDACHIGGDTTDFSCTDCHEHSASNTNGEHDEVSGYAYESHACFDCHPTGGEGGD